MEQFLGYVSSFLGGGIFATLVFVFAQSNKMTKIDTKVEAVSEDLAKLFKELHNGFTCKNHANLMEKLGNIEGKLGKHD